MNIKLVSKIVCLVGCFSKAMIGLGQSQPVIIHIDPHQRYQTIDNFGASDAWAGQFTGLWPDSERQKIADLLFSADTLSNGQPKGIALSLWRFNIGAGSAEQQERSGIRDEWRRAECFADGNGNYDWKKQAGQLWFLQAAKKRGVPQFLAFNNSPPVWMTRNGKAYADSGHTNLAPGKYADYARFLASVIKGVREHSGVYFNYVSPVNEPQWDWSDGGQEGCPYNNAEMASLFRQIDLSFKKSNITTKILAGEAGSIQYTYLKGDKPGKGKQGEDFFSPQSPNYIGDLPAVAKLISAHSYFTTSPQNKSVQQRQDLAADLRRFPAVKYWQSEYCILGDNAGEIEGNRKDLGMTAALYLAKVIHTDLTVANAAAWQWWTAISAYDYKDGLIYIDRNKQGGHVTDSKMLWVLGNYSRFIRPGFTRVAASGAGANDELYTSAYIQGKKLVVVLTNNSAQPKTIEFKISGKTKQLKRAYVTSDGGNLKPEQPGKSVVLPARSVVTLTGTI